MRALVFDVQRYSIGDGPGIRTTLFLKGCDMRCAWCENPESFSPSPQLSFAEDRCIGCSSCAELCPRSAIALGRGFPADGKICDACGRCALACPTRAMRIVGTWREIDELLSELLADRDYWSASGGGVTISGGEATLQRNFVGELLARLRAEGVHTVLQTNGNAPWEALEPLAREADLLHFDLKGIDGERHLKNTGVGNERILSNARRLSEGGCPAIFRIPLVPGFNDSPDDLRLLKDFLDSIGARSVDLLPYHGLGERKLDLLGMRGRRLGIKDMSEEEAAGKALSLAAEGRELLIRGESLASGRFSPSALSPFRRR